MPTFSVIMPTYRELGHIPHNVRRLAGKDVEFIVVADCLSKEDVKRLEELSKEYPMRLDVSEERRGKVAGLNRGIELARGDILVFIDSDTLVLRDDLLERIRAALSSADFGSGVITILPGTLWQRLIRVDYLFLDLSAWVGKKSRVSFGLNGALIFAKREVAKKVRFEREITEDIDFAIRASKAGYVPTFIELPLVAAGAPSTLRAWYKQRKRWAIGASRLIFKHWRFVLKKPLAAVLQTVLVLPFIFVLLPLLLLPNNHLAKLASFLSSLLLAFVPVLSPVVLATMGYILAKHLLITLVGALFILLWAKYWARRFSLRLPALDILLYYFVYAPIWTALSIAAVVYVALKRGRVYSVAGWKV